MTLAERFEQRVIHQDGCWDWNGATRNGYGVIGRGARIDGLVYAHRLSWELNRGPIPEGLCVLHTCDNRRCTRPDHLFLGTKLDNNRDMAAKGRHVGTRRLTPGQVAEIRSSTDKASTLANRFGVSTWNIYNIRSGRTWAA